MNATTIGLVAATISAILLGSYFVPFKFSKLTVNQYLLIMFVFSTLTLAILFVYTRESTSIPLSAFSLPVVSGVLFGVALFLVFFAIKTVGVNTAAAIYVGLQLVIAAVIGIVFFNELGPLSSMQRLETVIGIVLVLAGIIFITVAKLGVSA